MYRAALVALCVAGVFSAQEQQPVFRKTVTVVPVFTTVTHKDGDAPERPGTRETYIAQSSR